MRVSASFKEFLIEQMAGFGPVTIRPMFGGAGVMRDGLMFALIDHEVLYLKADDETKAGFVAENLSQFTYMAKDGKKKTLKVTQIGSPIARRAYQRETLIGLGLNKINRTRELEDTPSVRGMVNKLPHLVVIVEERG